MTTHLASATRIYDALQHDRLLAIVRGTDPAAAVRCVLALAEVGATLIEVSLTTPDAFRVIAEARRSLGDGFLLGAGTVVERPDAARAVEEGAGFVVTPALTPGAEAAHDAGVPTIAGALTPTEVVAALGLGALAVKVFPAATFGPPYIKALRDPLPNAPLVPVGGVQAENARAYLDAGAVAVGAAGGLIGDAASPGGDVAGLQQRTKRLLATLAATE